MAGNTGCPYVQSGILNKLRTAEGRPVSYDDLITDIWGLSEPDKPEECIRQAVSQLRRRGFPIASVFGRGYRFVPTI